MSTRKTVSREGVAVWSDFCAVAPSPELKAQVKAALADIRNRADVPLSANIAPARGPRPLGFDDGVIIPPEQFPAGTPYRSIRLAAAERAPLRGQVRVIVVLVDFSDLAMNQSTTHFENLFFSQSVLPNGSVREYFTEATNGLVDLTGEVVGPYRLPQTLAWYANNNFGIGRPSGTARANIMANDAVSASDPDVNFGPYDNDGNGFVDAFIVIHAGQGGEQTGNAGHIWSHKWVLPSARNVDAKQIFAYLTVPEDSRIGVCAHELGHLLFGFPDLYDTDDTSEGIGNWCLMAGGSWNGGGDVPAHPSAWCKANQGWAAVTNVSAPAALTLPDVKTSHNLHRAWTNGGAGAEYFLLENRQRTGFDRNLPGDGLLIWHIDENQPGNIDENHYKVALVQADGQRDMELDQNRGDAGDPYPGSTGNTAFTDTSTPNSKSYAGQNTCVSITNMSPSGPIMTASVAVSCGKQVVKDSKDSKDRKDAVKELQKERKDLRKEQKDFKEALKERKDIKDQREGKSPIKDFHDGGKGPKEIREQPSTTQPDEGFWAQLAELQARVEALEGLVGGSEAIEPFITEDLRPTLSGGPEYGSESRIAIESRMASGDSLAKREFDTAPRR